MNEFTYGDYWEVSGNSEQDRRDFIEKVVSKLEQLTGLQREGYLIGELEDVEWPFIIVEDGGYICVCERLDSYTDKPNRRFYSELFGEETEPTDDLQYELYEAYAKIDTLESALEDAVKELISLRKRNNAAVIDLKESEFKPISEYTLEDWELAKENKWRFADNRGDESLLVQDIVNDEVYFSGYGYPFTVSGVHTEKPEEFKIIRRLE